MNNIHKLIDTLPDHLIQLLENEWNVIKVGNIYINKPNKIRIPMNVYNLFVKNNQYNDKYVLSIAYFEDGRFEKQIRSRRDWAHFYKWMYFKNGDILYRSDTFLESRQHILIKYQK